MHHTTREGRLTAALMEAADTLTETFDTGDYLRRLADHCVELLSAWAAGIVLIDGGEAVALGGSTYGGREEIAFELLAAQRNGGPCLESYRSGRPVPPVSISAAHADARWPEFTERALRHGVVATFAVPVRRRDTLLGAVNVFVPTLPNCASDSWRSELVVAQALADSAGLGLENHRAYAQSRSLAGQLQEALSSRVRIEQAKGMLAERWQVGTDEAFIALRGHARRRRMTLDRVARAVIEGGVVDRL
ncbi:ANTAR domain-containing protein [Streptomyces sp. NBC_00986]|uniref:ANTAR domain-containing protein n=1 Tax=Streptomyces sp. NBC_00986 TaxID=2903702 RepID=UPI00386B359B|nr:ANTAR domain-containing protein [Streptomyces sp. NBC_00986]